MKNVIQFLTELKKNNSREWFQANKKKYDQQLILSQNSEKKTIIAFMNLF